MVPVLSWQCFGTSALLSHKDTLKKIEKVQCLGALDFGGAANTMA